MAATEIAEEDDHHHHHRHRDPKISSIEADQSKGDCSSLSLYFGMSFAVFLAFLPRSAMSFVSSVSSIQSRNRALAMKLVQAEDQLRQMKSRRKEDSKANARVVEIFASHRNGWQQEEKKLVQQIEAVSEENAHLRARVEDLEKSDAELRICVEKLQREVEEREEMINFMSRRSAAEEDDEDFAVGAVEKVEVKTEVDSSGVQMRRGGFDESEEFVRDRHVDLMRFGREVRVSSEGLDGVHEEEEFLMERVDEAFPIGQEFMSSAASKFWSDTANGWQQDMQYDFLEPQFQLKHFVTRRESPWKVDGESTGVPSKLKVLEQELVNLEIIDKGELSKVPSLMRKQAKRYQALAGKIEDLCRRMQSNDPCEPTLTTEFRTRRQTEFLLEAYRLQQRAMETGQKLTALQSEIGKGRATDNLVTQAKLTTKRSLDSIRNNFKEIQRNLEVWLARIMGDLEGLLARDGASRVRDFYPSKYPFVR
ncbi:hypothetical protein Scep_027098 [Stephania cephalantha]|uniref:Uncharacterized protein n=1 Tax=Stephania cephalantha TaxID=152367 RepID=A0AAP0ELU4_9MAGN